MVVVVVVSAAVVGETVAVGVYAWVGVIMVVAAALRGCWKRWETRSKVRNVNVRHKHRVNEHRRRVTPKADLTSSHWMINIIILIMWHDWLSSISSSRSSRTNKIVITIPTYQWFTKQARWRHRAQCSLNTIQSRSDGLCETCLVG